MYSHRHTNHNRKRPHYYHRHYVCRTPFVSRTPTPLISIIQRKNDEENDAKNNDDTINVPLNVPLNVPVNVPVKLTDTQLKVFELICNDINITHLEIANKLGITDKTAKRTTLYLREVGMITREGSDKTGNWVILIEN